MFHQWFWGPFVDHCFCLSCYDLIELTDAESKLKNEFTKFLIGKHSIDKAITFCCSSINIFCTDDQFQCSCSAYQQRKKFHAATAGYSSNAYFKLAENSLVACKAHIACSGKLNTYASCTTANSSNAYHR